MYLLSCISRLAKVTNAFSKPMFLSLICTKIEDPISYFLLFYAHVHHFINPLSTAESYCGLVSYLVF